MGHIANKIDAKDKNLADILFNRRYRIDSFQREYRWQRKHIEALISDLSISFLKNYTVGDIVDDYEKYDAYYMGPIVLCDDSKDISIVDGQQRLTSFTLLLIFLMHAQRKLNLPEEYDLKPFIYVTKKQKTTLILNVESRNKIVEHLYNYPDVIFDDYEDPIDESIQNIIARYEDITKLFSEEINNEVKLPIFIEWLLNKVVMVEVKAYSIENAYSIFETMNDRGLSLSPTEILKGFILSKINDEDKSDEMNDFWKKRIADIKYVTGSDGDLDFFRAWLRAKYAQTIRETKQGAENEDFELLGTQFHSWVKNNPQKTGLKTSDDYYFFIRSDFDFFSSLYIKIFNNKNQYTEKYEGLYVSNYYPIADSLYYPLILSPVSKLDDEDTISEKINVVGEFIDKYTNLRVIAGKAITQSSIRNYIYELIRSIRNASMEELTVTLLKETSKLNDTKTFGLLHQMDNWGYYHYFFARILYSTDVEVDDFQDLMRSRRQKSLVLAKLFNEEDKPDHIENDIWNLYSNSVAAFALIRRYDISEYYNLPIEKRIKFLIKNGYLPEMEDLDISIDIQEFITMRDEVLREIVVKMWQNDSL